MRTRRQAVLATVATLAIAHAAQAAITVDGTLDAGYGAALWTAPAEGSDIDHPRRQA